MSDFAVRDTILAAGFAGFGAQYNHNVYAPISHAAGVTTENVGEMEKKLAALKPQLVRVFFNGDALDDSVLMDSFQRTMKLAQSTATTINVTFQGIGPHAHSDAMPAFAKVLHDLLVNKKCRKLKWVTIRNEPNDPSAPMPRDLYKQLHVQLGHELTGLGVGGRVEFMGGDLRIDNQQAWLAFLAEEMRQLLAAWSIHVYWNYFDPHHDIHGIEARLTRVRDLRDGFEVNGEHTPLYVTEYGARGLKEPGQTKADPGLHRDGRPLATTTVNAFQHAWFSLRAASLGYRGTVKWDAYQGMYDAHPQAYSALGQPQEGWPEQPVYRLLRLLTTTVRPGSNVLQVDGTNEKEIVVAFAGPQGRFTVLGLHTDGGALNEKDVSDARPEYRLTGLPPDTSFQLRFWNFARDGRNSAPARPRTDSSGSIPVAAPLHSVFALTSAGS